MNRHPKGEQPKGERMGEDGIETTEQAREVMRAAVEVTAGLTHEVLEPGQWWAPQDAPALHRIIGDVRLGYGPPPGTLYQEGSCPVCIATKALEAIDAAEARPGGLL